MLLQPRPDFDRAAHPMPADAFLLVEVANTSLRHDRARKLPLYARAAVVEVWIVNLGNESVEVYRRPSEAGYGGTHVARRGHAIAPAAFPDCRLAVDDLLG